MGQSDFHTDQCPPQALDREGQRHGPVTPYLWKLVSSPKICLERYHGTLCSMLGQMTVSWETAKQGEAVLPVLLAAVEPVLGLFARVSSSLTVKSCLVWNTESQAGHFPSRESLEELKCWPAVLYGLCKEKWRKASKVSSPSRHGGIQGRKFHAMWRGHISLRDTAENSSRWDISA